MYVHPVNKYTTKMCDACCHLLKQNKLSIILFAMRQYFANSPSWPWPHGPLAQPPECVYVHMRKEKRESAGLLSSSVLSAYSFDANLLPEPGALFSCLSWNPAIPNNLPKFTQTGAEAYVGHTACYNGAEIGTPFSVMVKQPFLMGEPSF